MAIENMTDIIHAGALRLHQQHCLSSKNKTLSIGLVRMANINQLVAAIDRDVGVVAPMNAGIEHIEDHRQVGG